MIFKGHRFRRSRALHYRMAKEGDFYVGEGFRAGQPIESNYIVICRLKDGVKTGFNEDLNTTYYNVKDAPSVPITGHSRTNLAYGELFTEYGIKYRRIYCVIDAVTYVGRFQVS